MKCSKGFSLVEMSVVVLIVGLVTAGVLTGRTVVEQSKIRAQVSDLQRYKTAYYAFKEQFKAIPGDFNKAGLYWGGSVPDGNGDHKLPLAADDILCSDTNEHLIFFTHLSQSGLIDKNFTNIRVLDAGYPSLKIDPAKGMGTAGGLVGGTVGNNYTFELQNSETFYVKAALDLQVSYTDLASLSFCFKFNDHLGTASPVMYHAVDDKIDDGLASDGDFIAHRVWRSYYGNCLTAASGDYLLSNDRPACNALYILEH